MDKNELLHHIQQCEKLHHRRQRKRNIILILIYAAVQFWIIYIQDQLDTTSIIPILGEIGSCIILGCIIFYFNLLIWSRVFKKNNEELAALEYLRKRLKEKEQEDIRRK